MSVNNEPQCRNPYQASCKQVPCKQVIGAENKLITTSSG